LKTINESKEFIKILQTLNIYFGFNIKVYEINYKTTSKNREKTLIKFKNDNSCINIICNVHILDEGIDIPECDSVYLTHPNNNPVNIIQRISRSNRLDVNNKEKISRIFIWSKNQIKLDQIINRLSKYIKIKYGKETNEIINNNIKKVCNVNITMNYRLKHKEEYDINTNLDTKEEFEKIKNEIVKPKITNSINSNKTINLENISKLLHVRKDNLKKLLIHNFEDVKDYIEFKGKNTGKGKGSNNTKTILLTNECAKLLCIISRSKKATLTRSSYINQ